MKLGVYVGSFNPIHIGHERMMDYLVENKYVEKIIIVPTNSYWHKKIDTDIFTRIEMIKKLKKDYLIIDKENNVLKYTYEVLRNIQKKYQNDELYLIIGADNMVTFDKWKNIEELLQYKILVLNRNNINIKKYTNKYKTNNFIVVDNYPFINISSTELRKHLKREYLNILVYEYIIKNKLYQK